MSVEKVAIITAGGSGMGAAAARRLAADGYKVGILSSSGKGEALAAELGGIGVTGSNQSVEDLQRLVDAVDIPISINIGFGIRSRPTTPLIPVRRLKELGVKRVSVPRMLPAAALKAMENALALLRHTLETGEVLDRPDLLFSIDDIKTLMDYETLERLEEELLLPEQLFRKYQAEKARI